MLSRTSIPLTIDALYGLVKRSAREPGKPVEISRMGATWRGTIVGAVTEPAVVLEQEDGQRTVIVIDGANYEVIEDA